MSKNNSSLKKDIIKEIGHICQSCNLSEWLGKPITLELEHIDGNNMNDCRSNLKILCPNCHSQTDTWRGRNIRKNAITDEDFSTALNNNKSIRAALMQLGLTPKGKNYERAASLLNLTYKEKDTNNSQFGTMWINNTKENKKIKKELLIEFESCGWVKGRILNIKPPSSKGKTWITNGTKSTRIDNTPIPEGWWEGRH